MKRLSQAFTAAFVVASLAGCNQPDLIDRTQPNFVKKSDLLDGQWYIKETIVDVPKTPGAPTVQGAGGGLEKIRWEVQEGLLVGYRSYEVVPGADPTIDSKRSEIGDVRRLDGKPYKGNPVFAFTISSHFDRQRQYNPSTGEVSNILEENSSDRPWYQREFMRIDWGTNRVANYSSILGTPRDDPNRTFRVVTDQDQNAQNNSIAFRCDDGTEGKNSSLVCKNNSKLNYFDYTVQRIYDPPAINYPGYGRIPFCLFNATVDCESASVMVRVSVLKVDEDRVRDYEPLVYSDKLMIKFGLFRNELFTYNKERGYTYTGQQFFAMRHNIWAKAKQVETDEAGKPVIDTLTGRAKLKTIPVTRRPVRPVVYYMTENTPRELWGSATQRHAIKAGFDPKNTIEASWDRAFRRAVAVPRGLELYDEKMPQMFYVCESPVEEGSPAACGKPGTYARLGDLRYHMAPYVDQNAGGLLGLGPSAMDPETGEVVNAVANVYGPALDTWAGSSSQVIDVLNGELSLSELITGKDIKDFVLSNLNPTDPRRPRTGPFTSQQPLTSDPAQAAGSFTTPTGRLAALLEQWTRNGPPPVSKNGADGKAVFASLLAKNPAVEDELINLPEVRVGVQASAPNRAFAERMASDKSFYRLVARNVLLGVDPVAAAIDAEKHRVDPSIGCYYEYSYSDEDYVGVAKRKLKLQGDLISKFTTQGSADCATPTACSATEARKLAKAEVYNDLRREAYRSVMEHEMGHTLGLRHNFIASADALNYQDGYWDLRKETIGVIAGGRRVLPVTPQNLVDAAKLNERQTNESLYEYTYSSIMDYGSRVNAMNRGIGKYDEAAILFSYAGGFEPGWVEVFNSTRNDYQNPAAAVEVDNLASVFSAGGAHVEVPLAIAEHYTSTSKLYTDKYHYTTLPFHFAEAAGTFEQRLDQGIARMKNRSFRKWSEMQAVYERIGLEVKRYEVNAAGLGVPNSERTKILVNNAGGRSIPVEVPYMFCSDSEVAANVLCNRQDQGADVYEMTSKWMERFNQSYVFSNFRRDRLQFSPDSVSSGKFARFLGSIPNVYQQWLFNVYIYVKYYRYSSDQIASLTGADPILQNYWTMAAIDSTNLLLQQLTIPSAGYHGKRPDGSWEYIPSQDSLNRRLSPAAEAALKADVARPAKGGYTDLAYLPRGQARSQFTVFDSFGYDNFNRINEVGHFWDVFAATRAIITSQTQILGVDRNSDIRQYTIPYYFTFKKELAPLYGAYFTEEPEYYSPMLSKNADGTASVMLPTFVKANDYIFGFNYPPAPVMPVDGNGNAAPVSKVLPVSTWSARFYSQLWTMAFFPRAGDNEYLEFSKVYRLGSSEALSPAPGFDVVSVADPFGGGYSYSALRQLDVSRPSTGALIVLRAQTQKAKWDQAKALNQPIDGLNAVQWEGKLRDTVRSMEILRGFYNIFAE